jgi:hypothetical protein
MTPKTIITILAVWLAVLLVLVLGGFLIIQNKRFYTDFAPLTGVCQGKPANVAAMYSSTSGQHPTIGVKKDSTGWQLYTGVVPGGVVAGSFAETQLVVCIGEAQEVFIEYCEYTTQENGRYATNILERYYYKQEVKIIDAKTGRVVALQVFNGAAPPYCHGQERFSQGQATRKSMGDKISDSEIIKWVKPYASIK